MPKIVFWKKHYWVATTTDCFEPIFGLLRQLCFEKHRSASWSRRGMFSELSGRSVNLFLESTFVWYGDIFQLSSSYNRNKCISWKRRCLIMRVILQNWFEPIVPKEQALRLSHVKFMRLVGIAKEDMHDKWAWWQTRELCLGYKRTRPRASCLRLYGTREILIQLIW